MNKSTTQPGDSLLPKEEVEKSEVALREEETLSFWNENKIFQKSLEQDAPKGEFVFYDGPPFATGLPHYGHLIPSTMKDIIPRYKTMQGFRVARKWGWDCHGLPIENLIEKELGLESKTDIEKHGVDNFNEAARASVMRYDAQWKEIIPRTGRFVDMDNAYKSMDSTYTESVWWSFKSLFDKGLAYEHFKSMHLCPRCETTLANFEVNQGYKDITDLSVTAEFKLVMGQEYGNGEKVAENTSLLAWTTTPWTLPGNVALALGKDVDYVIVEKNDEGTEGESRKVRFIVAKELIEANFGESEKEYGVLSELKGSDLLGLSYEPVFDYFAKQTDLENRENGWKIFAADFVTTTDGTGIVHIAPAFGEDDMNLGRDHNLPWIQHVTKGGIFTDEVADFAGMLVKKKDDHMAADIQIIKWLAHNGKLFSKKKYIHSYPHCWRCDTPLLNYATTSWFLNVQKIKKNLIANNAQTNWTPSHMRDGRFGKWLEGARDWALSRSRYWGAVLPVWKNPETEELTVVGSFEELKSYTPKSGNTYTTMRHGESQSNVDGVVSLDPKNEKDHLTEKGIGQVKKAVVDLASKSIDLIVVSPLYRTRQSAEIVREELGLSVDQVVIEPLFSEWNIAEHFEGEKWGELKERLENNEGEYWYDHKESDGESLRQLQSRFAQGLFNLEEKYKGKNILVVAHKSALRCAQVATAAKTEKDAQAFYEQTPSYENAQIDTLNFVSYPHNALYEFDVHRPYIDNFQIEKDGQKLELLGDVFDVWYESGSMPYASLHYPFENKELFDETRKQADFIAEGLDQTRGWFYVLMVLSTGLFDRPAFKNVICHGMLMAEDGKKMSKRLQNYPPVQHVLNSFGADVMRFFLMNIPVVAGEEGRISEKGLAEVQSKMMNRLRNTYRLYETYTSDEVVASTGSPHILDKWIMARLAKAQGEVTDSLEKYILDRGTREILSLFDDLSTWYVRRSRDRYKAENTDSIHALSTTKYVMTQITKLIAPYTPFLSEELWQKLGNKDQEESVHLSKWEDAQELSESQKEVLQKMEQTRSLVSEILEARDQVKIKVRQPLASATIREVLDPEYLELIKEEVNVKEVVVNVKQEQRVSLDTELTQELKEEGYAREIVRTIQSMRKKSGLTPQDRVNMSVSTDESGKALIEKWEENITTPTQIDSIKYLGNLDGDETKALKISEAIRVTLLLEKNS